MSLDCVSSAAYQYIRDHPSTSLALETLQPIQYPTLALNKYTMPVSMVVDALSSILSQSHNYIPVLNHTQPESLYEGDAGRYAGADGGNCNMGSQKGANITASSPVSKSGSDKVSTITFAQTIHQSNHCPPFADICH